MDVKRWECEIETKEEEHKEDRDSIHSIVFTAGTFLVMVCLKHFLVEKWRDWVFLVLNIILLAILFMSMKPGFWGTSSESEGNVEQVKNDKKEKIRPCECPQENEEGKECYKKKCWTSTHVQIENEEDENEEEEDVAVLSKEELNQRVEAFIAMFRQHLISDVKQAENFRFNKTTNLTPKIQVPCF